MGDDDELMMRESKLRDEEEMIKNKILTNISQGISELKRMFIQKHKECEDDVVHIGEESITSVDRSKVEDIVCFQQPFLSLDSNVSSLDINNHLHCQALSPFKVCNELQLEEVRGNSLAKQGMDLIFNISLPSLVSTLRYTSLFLPFDSLTHCYLDPFP